MDGCDALFYWWHEHKKASLSFFPSMICYSFCLLHMEAPLNGEDERESSSLWHMGRSASQKNTHFSGVASVQPPCDRRSIASVPSYHHRGCYGAAFGKNSGNYCYYISLLKVSSAVSMLWHESTCAQPCLKEGLVCLSAILQMQQTLSFVVSFFSKRSIWPRNHVQISLNTSVAQP